MKMDDKILKEAEIICEKMFPDNEVAQFVLHHHLACFADYVEVLAIKKFRDEMDEFRVSYKPEEVNHG